MGEIEIHRKQCERWNVRGHFRYLTFSCFRRQAFLTGDRARGWLVEAIEAAREELGFQLVAYVFMPEHVHLIVLPRVAPYDSSRILGRIKLPVSRTARRWVEEHAPEFLERMLDVQPNGKRAVRFWQRGGGYDRNLYSEEELWEKIQYVHMNPVRRKLVEEAAAWEWSSARAYANLEVGKIRVDREALPWVRE